MKHIFETAEIVENLKTSLQQHSVKAGKAFRRHCVRLASAAAYRDLEDIHQEIAARRAPSWEDIGPTLHPHAED